MKLNTKEFMAFALLAGLLFFCTQVVYAQRDACDANAYCPEGDPYPKTKRSVVRLRIGNGYCSATLLNNTAEDDKPYVITAGHCFGGINDDYNTVMATSDISIDINYNVACNDAGNPQDYITLSGGKLRVWEPLLDIALIEMDDPIPCDANVYFAGWDRNGPDVTTHMSKKHVLIHHKAGLPKCLSIAPEREHHSYMTTKDPNTHPIVTNNMWTTPRWDVGDMGGGSSGGGLFYDDEYIIGVLGGPHDGNNEECENAHLESTRFHVFYDKWTLPNETCFEHEFSKWLDPLNTGVMRLEGKECGGGSAPSADFSAETNCLTVNFASSSTGNPTTYEWNFGDGNTSNQVSPEHTYNEAGTYTVTLTVENEFGEDTEVKTDFITLEVAGAPQSEDVEVCTGMSATLVASGADSFIWYDAAQNGNELGRDPSYVTPALTQTSTYYVASGGCSTGERTQVDVIVVTLNAPNVQGGTFCEGDTAILRATGTGELNWYLTENGTSAIHVGTDLYVDTLTTNTTFFVAGESSTGILHQLGPIDNDFGSGDYFNGDRDDLGIILDVEEDVLWKSARVYASEAGDRFIVIKDAPSGNILESATIFIDEGESIIEPNLIIPAGNDIFIGIEGVSNLYRHTSGTSYPYISGPVTIKTSSASSADDYYYFFYNMLIESSGCKSERTAVTAEILASPAVPEISIDGDVLSITDENVSYQWYFDGDVINGAIKRTLQAIDEGLYQVEITNDAGCKRISENFLYQITAHIESLHEGFYFYPNPVNENLHIHNSINEKAYLELVNTQGSIILKVPIDGGHSNLTLNKLVSGTYLLKLTTDNEVFTHLISVE